MNNFIGIDAGSVSVKAAVADAKGSLIEHRYMMHRGDPLGACAEITLPYAGKEAFICVTGSARRLIGAAIDAHLVKNEITALWRSMHEHFPHAGTVIEIGGQDSKCITMINGEIESFKLNSVCAAGTGSFLEQQAQRMGLNPETLSRLALTAETKARFTGRCTVFAETEMINLQQRGFTREAIAGGLFDAVCENYLKDCTPGLTLRSPYIFCGGTAALDALVNAFSFRLNADIIRPEFYRAAGAYGAALLARDLYTDSTKLSPRILRFKEKNTVMPQAADECGDCLACGKCYAGN